MAGGNPCGGRRPAPGDTVVIPPGLRDKLWNTGDEPLRLLCCCSPAYSHEDTVLTASPDPVTALVFNDGIDGVGLGEFPALCASFFAEPRAQLATRPSA
ncbi:MAG TPA: hypothetical protein VER75_04530, partial [Thermoleophilaceae bacterium]|nr:hypothetical protein [Thermoleophilaceae bacterium]